VARLATSGRESTARAPATSATVSPPGSSRCRRRTLTTASTAEQSQVTSSAPLARASPAALASGERPAGAPGGPIRGVSAASAAMSAAVCAAALATTSAPTSTATTPASRTSPVRASPTRVAPPRSPAGLARARERLIGGSDAGARRVLRSFEVRNGRRSRSVGPGVAPVRGRRPRWR
jgi:hypothetical protein